MPKKSFGKTAKPGKELARLFGKQLAAAVYRLPASKGQQFGRAGWLLKKDSDYGRKYAERLCVCDRPLNFGRLSIYSDGNCEPSLVHFGCAMRAVAWSRLVTAHCYSSVVCFGPSYAPEPKLAEPVDLTAVWASYNRHMPKPEEPAEAELTETLEQIREVVAEIAEPEPAELQVDVNDDASCDRAVSMLQEIQE